MRRLDLMKHPAVGLAGLLLGGVLGALVGCDALTQEARFWVCDPYSHDPHPDNPCPFPCDPCNDDPDPKNPCPCPTAVGCAGQCVPSGPLNWTRDPFLLWIGDNDIEAPECPDRARNQAYEGHADLVAPDECGPCSCGAPSCELPVGLTAHSTPCPGDGPGNVDTSFDAPADWGGSCVAPPAVPANLLGSVTIAPLTVSPCVPETGPIPTAGQAYWKKYARACLGEAMGSCEDSAQVCSPTAEPPPPGFVQCIQYLREGDADCPGDYPVKHVFYEGINDTRNCTPCSCGAPEGSFCTALVSYYNNANCTSLMLTTWIGDVGQCHPTMAGSVLQSMSAMLVDNQPGFCQASGGVPYGEATPTNPSTFCCQE
jgi:hypothetical protein